MRTRILIVTGLMLLVATAAFAADEAPFKIVKNNAVRAAKGTGLQGTISVAALPAELQQLTCKDLAVHVGVLHASSAALTSFASSAATGDISTGQCSFNVPGLPAGGPFDVIVVAESVKNGCKLGDGVSVGKMTFTRGQMGVLEVKLIPSCH